MTEIHLMTAEHTYWNESISWQEIVRKDDSKHRIFLWIQTMLSYGAKIKLVLLMPLLQEEGKTGM